MKYIISILIAVGVFLGLQMVIPTNDEFEIYENTVRLHVLANSDTEADQSLKLKVRDALLERVNSYGASTKEEAVSQIDEARNELIEIAENVVKVNGYDYEVSIEISQEMYPTRYYEDFALPAGKYTSVRVIIGEGEGENWWCVLYPPLCTAAAVSYDEDYCIEAGLTKGQYNLITENESGEYKIKFRLLELVQEVFGFKND